jgi:hypothetical protein
VTTWTPTALEPEVRPWRGGGWRAVEAQHRVASLQLAGGSLPDQALLEDILEQTKPPLPTAAAGLHFLLATPFRYPPAASGSRFRAPFEPGVFYGAEERATACAEAGYWRLRFWRDSEGLRTRRGVVEMTLFRFRAAAARSLDLEQGGLSRDAPVWQHPGDYGPTQSLGRSARAAGVAVLRYGSVRQPGGHCLALLDPAVFRAVPKPWAGGEQTWTLLLNPPAAITWQRHLVAESLAFSWPELAPPMGPVHGSA